MWEALRQVLLVRVGHSHGLSHANCIKEHKSGDKRGWKHESVAERRGASPYGEWLNKCVTNEVTLSLNSPGRMVKSDGTCARGSEFESQHPRECFFKCIG